MMSECVHVLQLTSCGAAITRTRLHTVHAAYLSTTEDVLAEELAPRK